MVRVIFEYGIASSPLGTVIIPPAQLQSVADVHVPVTLFISLAKSLPFDVTRMRPRSRA
jgi:hypothetical protein